MKTAVKDRFQKDARIRNLLYGAFVIVDEKGGVYALSKRVTGITAHEMRAPGWY